MRKTTAVISLAITILFCGCSGTSVSSVSDINWESLAPATEDSSLSISNDSILPDVISQAEKTLSAVSDLPDYQIDAVFPSEEELYYILSGRRIDETVHAAAWSFPNNEGTAVLLQDGQEPYFDYWLDVANYNNVGTDVVFFTKRSYYVDAVFYPQEDIEFLSEEKLSFSDSQAAQKDIEELLMPYGSIGEISCHSLSGSDLQRLYDRRKRDGTLRIERYASSGEIKDSVRAAEKSAWNSEDDTYYIKAKQMISGIPLYGSEIEAWIDARGIQKLSVSGLAAVTEEASSKQLAGLSELLCAIDTVTDNLYAKETTVVDLSLNYVRMPGGNCRPLWRVSADYEFQNSVTGTSELRRTTFWLDAFTADEVILDGV